jgi:hypothetical protein
MKYVIKGKYYCLFTTIIENSGYLKYLVLLLCVLSVHDCRILYLEL